MALLSLESTWSWVSLKNKTMNRPLNTASFSCNYTFFSLWSFFDCSPKQFHCNQLHHAKCWVIICKSFIERSYKPQWSCLLWIPTKQLLIVDILSKLLWKHFYQLWSFSWTSKAEKVVRPKKSKHNYPLRSDLQSFSTTISKFCKDIHTHTATRLSRIKPLKTVDFSCMLLESFSVGFFFFLNQHQAHFKVLCVADMH